MSMPAFRTLRTTLLASAIGLVSLQGFASEGDSAAAAASLALSLIHI